MIVFLAILFLLVAGGLFVRPQGGVEAALSKEQTRVVKGIFVITVFFSHFCSYVTFSRWFDKPMIIYCHWLGQLMVVPFLLYSGYGVFESAKKKGAGYVKSLPRKRILKTLVHFDLALLLFVAFDACFAPDRLSVANVLSSLLAWSDVGNSNWFIFAILCAYLFCFAGLSLFPGNRFRAFLMTFFLCIAYIVVVSRFKEQWWWNSILAFPLGCAVSLWKDKLAPAGKTLPWCACCAIGLGTLVANGKGLIPGTAASFQIALLAMGVLLVVLPMRMGIESKPLAWFGDQIFGIYILQRLPMEFGKCLRWNESCIFLYFLFCLSTTLLLAVAFAKLTRFLDCKWFGDA